VKVERRLFSAAFSFFARRRHLFVGPTGRRLPRLNLSLSDYFGLWRSAPAGRRFDIARKVRDLVRRTTTFAPAPAPGRCFDIGEFKSFEQFEIKYRQLADELGYPGKIPATGELEFLHAMVDLDDVRYPGGIGSRDYFFLTALISILAPRRVVEIGTLTGFSTAIIAAAIDRQHAAGLPGAGLPPGRKPVTVETIDCSTHCSIDSARPIGFEIPELIPDLASTVRVHPGRKSDLVRELAAPEEFGLAFIDADHRHPWPLLDVLRLAPYVKSRAWILLHDIQLGTYGNAERDPGNKLEGGTPFGAEWLFDRWPFRKIRSFHIGAIELPRKKDALIPFALDLMQEPFEITGKAAKRIRRSLYESFADLI
jgi:hypothetical protein